jgi:hypothetical protein
MRAAKCLVFRMDTSFRFLSAIPTGRWQSLARCGDAGFSWAAFVPRPVPPGTSRLRVSVSAVHPQELIDALAANLADVLRGVFG